MCTVSISLTAGQTETAACEKRSSIHAVHTHTHTHVFTYVLNSTPTHVTLTHPPEASAPSKFSGQGNEKASRSVYSAFRIMLICVTATTRFAS